jgi:DNA invertase Pin-like site-specific DNA recombinase
MTIYGYARVSTDGQTLASQDAQLHAAGCIKVYGEKVSGAKTDRAELGKLLRRLERGAGPLYTGPAQYPAPAW